MGETIDNEWKPWFGNYHVGGNDGKRKRICSTCYEHQRQCKVINANFEPLLKVIHLETVQDFLIKLDIKPPMHLLEISIFSLNNDLLRLTKIMNNLVKDLKILYFKVIFQCLKLVESFKKKFCEEYLIRRPTYINDFFMKTLIFKVLYLVKMCSIFVDSVHNFGK